MHQSVEWKFQSFIGHETAYSISQYNKRWFINIDVSHKNIMQENFYVSWILMSNRLLPVFWFN